MAYFDVFNGDADGLCALQQLRLAEPRAATLVTGVKRDIALLRRVPRVAGASVTVLDVSLAQNRDALVGLLQCGAQVAYFDHHYAGDTPHHAGLELHIDTAPDVCTSLLVDRHLGGAHALWAVAGAFGDNLGGAARRRAAPLALQAAQLEALRELGESLNYNAYGDREDDLFVHPAELHRRMRRFADPLRFLQEEPLLRVIRDGRIGDLERARAVPPHAAFAGAVVVLLPDAAWSRRVRGAWGNALALASPQRANAVLTQDGRGDYVVSVRAPLAAPRGAETLCRQFPTGGGRAAAAGINRLAQADLPDFVRAFEKAYGPVPPR